MDVTHRDARGGPIGTVARVLNGAINGAIIGGVYAGSVGAVLGGVFGAVGGAAMNAGRRRRRGEEEGDDDGPREFGTRIVVRSGPHLVRYDGPRGIAPYRESELYGRDLERSLLEVLVRMNRNDFGPGRGGLHMHQSEESFEELIRRFGHGTEGRAASTEVIDSYPVEVVVRGDGVGGAGKRSRDDDGAEVDTEDGEELEFGTCGICLEDYRVGEKRKRLSCPNHPHSFHAECIDRWLKVVASCPICKNAVVKYEPAAS